MLIHKLLKTLTLAAAGTAMGSASAADVRSPRTPESLEAAVADVIATLNPSQRSIVKGTAKDSLHLLLPEWGKDIEERLFPTDKDSRLRALVCKRTCASEEAALVIMEAAWEELQRR